MKWLDRVLQNWRISKAAAFIRPGARVLDIGSATGALYRRVRGIGEYVGIDPDVPQASHDRLPENGYSLRKGFFPEALSDSRKFDVITLLAVLEHIPPDQQKSLAQNCLDFLSPNGKLVITVPSQAVDAVLAVLKFLRLIDGMNIEEHYGFDAGQTEEIFTKAGFRLVRHRRFQIGLNNLYVFEPVREA